MRGLRQLVAGTWGRMGLRARVVALVALAIQPLMLVILFKAQTDKQDGIERVLAEEHLRRSLAEKETLLREVRRRVKNNLQIVSSLLSLQAKKVKNPDALAAIPDGRDRLRAMVLVRQKLYRSSELTRIDFGDYIRTLLAQLAESYMPRERSIATRVGLPDGFVAEASDSFGRQLINSLAAQIGSVMMAMRGHGTTLTVSSPYREVVS